MILDAKPQLVENIHPNPSPTGPEPSNRTDDRPQKPYLKPTNIATRPVQSINTCPDASSMGLKKTVYTATPHEQET
jgi:hypothetical protein